MVRLVRFVATFALAAAIGLAPTPSAHALPDGVRPYDQKLMRLAEILGAIHYLRELCGANDGQKWRNRVRDLIRTEGTTALRKATIARAFNSGYRGYGRTYRSCTNSAQVTIARFLSEAVVLSEALMKLSR